MTAYYNEIDPFAAEWLRCLIKMEVIPDGVVDERSIRDVRPCDLRDFQQCHFFAGIGVWAYALRDAGYPDDRTVFTGSCPCQPFSQAGAAKGVDDERHLWPDFLHLIRHARPDVVFGEQVASKDGLAWFDIVQTDLESEGFAVGAADLCAAGFGAPHIRQRLYFTAMADAESGKQRELRRSSRKTGQPDVGHAVDDMANADGGHASAKREQSGREFGLQPNGRGAGALPNAGDGQLPQPRGRPQGRDGPGSAGAVDGALIQRPGPLNGFWRDADWLHCTDDKWRPVEPASFPLADGIAGRMGFLRGYGNAIVLPQATAFIKATLEASVELGALA